MRTCGLRAREAVAWLRILRPGGLLPAPVARFLCDEEACPSPPPRSPPPQSPPPPPSPAPVARFLCDEEACLSPPPRSPPPQSPPPPPASAIAAVRARAGGGFPAVSSRVLPAVPPRRNPACKAVPPPRGSEDVGAPGDDGSDEEPRRGLLPQVTPPRSGGGGDADRPGAATGCGGCSGPAVPRLRLPSVGRMCSPPLPARRCAPPAVPPSGAPCLRLRDPARAPASRDGGGRASQWADGFRVRSGGVD
jgi:hypothetical protein